MDSQVSLLVKAYSSQLSEKVLDNLKIIGEIPTWLSGSFVSNGPTQFEVGATHFKHWFDGFAMLKKLQFQQGKVTFQNRFLHSEQYDRSCAAGKLYCDEFGTYASNTFLGRVRDSLIGIAKHKQYDNANINTINLGERYLAMTESSEVTEFNLSDLQTQGTFQFDDKLTMHLMLAHPHQEASGEIINVGTEIGQKIRHHVFKISPKTKKREIIKTFYSKNAFYMHSFSITKNYIILFKSPLVLNGLKLFLQFPFNKTVFWQKDTSSFFIIIDRRDGSLREIETEPFVCLHSANAFEDKDELVLDLICHGSGNPYDYFYRDNLQSLHPKLPHGILTRYRLDMKKNQAKWSNLSSQNQEFPRIHYAHHNGKDYQFVYTTIATKQAPLFLDSIQKTNINTGHSKLWQKEGYYPGESVFVANPEGKSEDDGILIFIAFNVATACSSFILLDARTMQQLAEVTLPFHLPFGLHGNFYK